MNQAYVVYYHALTKLSVLSRHDMKMFKKKKKPQLSCLVTIGSRQEGVI